jgi:predicted  nucleic acid-binding Zn-ribbon protein
MSFRGLHLSFDHCRFRDLAQHKVDATDEHLQLARATITKLHRKNSALEDKLARKEEELARMKQEFDDERHRMLTEVVEFGDLVENEVDEVDFTNGV